MPDVPAFKTLSNGRAYYVYTLSNKEGLLSPTDTFFDERYMTKPMTYKELLAESVVLPAFSYGEFVITIQKLCKKRPKDCEEAGNPVDKMRPFLSEPYAQILDGH